MLLTSAGKDVVVLDDLTVREFFGSAAGVGGQQSVAMTIATKQVKEAWQTPLFDEYVYVVEGEAEVWIQQPHEGAPLKVVGLSAGHAAFSPAGTRVRWCFSADTRVLAICSPGFTPELCPREEEGEAASPLIYHVAPKVAWERAKAEGKTYFPETFDKDGFVHGTSNAEVGVPAERCDLGRRKTLYPARAHLLSSLSSLQRIIEVLNTFYTDKPGDFVCLCM